MVTHRWARSASSRIASRLATAQVEARACDLALATQRRARMNAGRLFPSRVPGVRVTQGRQSEQEAARGGGMDGEGSRR
jgi:hypothetical protein